MPLHEYRFLAFATEARRHGEAKLKCTYRWPLASLAAGLP
jgi:hypothetical protein